MNHISTPANLICISNKSSKAWMNDSIIRICIREISYASYPKSLTHLYAAYLMRPLNYIYYRKLPSSFKRILYFCNPSVFYVVNEYFYSVNSSCIYDRLLKFKKNNFLSSFSGLYSFYCKLLKLKVSSPLSIYCYRNLW